MTLVPPLAGTLVGLALRLMPFTAAAPTVSVNASDAAPPEIAVIAAAPDWPLAMNRAAATPLSVRASVGDIAPRLVVNVTVVPFWTGVPLGSSTVARISVVPFACTIVLAVESVIFESCGASNGSLSQAAANTPALASSAPTQRFLEPPSPVMMESIRIEMSNYNNAMNLAARASADMPGRIGRTEAGYAMAALLVAMSVMAIMMSAAMPTWSHMIRREKEEELLFRGNQYARAINQYQRKYANASPATLDVLVEQRLLRKKFKDPLSPTKEGEFQMLYLNSRAGAPQGTTGTARGAGVGAGTGTGRAGAGAIGAGGSATDTQSGSAYSTTPSGGIVGVASKNTGTSIKIYKGKTKYNEWQFVGMEQSRQGGTGGAGGPGGPQRGGRQGGGRDGSGREGSGPGNRGGLGGGGFGGGGFGGRGDQGGGGRGGSPQR
jgi:type II secretory pathway pseudopilin PulG